MGMTGIVFVRPQQDGTRSAATGGDTARVRLQRRRRLDAVRPRVRASCSPSCGRTSTTATRTSRSDRDRLRPAVVHAQRPGLPADRAAERRSRPAGGAADSHPERQLRRRGRLQPADLGADPGQRRGSRVLLRLANLGYQQHAMQLPGIPMHVVGQDASLLAARRGGHLVLGQHPLHRTRRGPRRAVPAPAYDPARPSGSDGRGSYNVYSFKNRDWRRLTNSGRRPGPAGNDDRRSACTRPRCPPRPS